MRHEQRFAMLQKMRPVISISCKRSMLSDTALRKEFVMRIFTICCMFSVLFLLPGCAEMNISNPFESSTSSETYFDQFPDIPIPRDMNVDTKRSLVSVAQDGSKLGLLTVEGRVDKPSLANATILNMNRQGWALRGTINSNKVVQLYEKDNRYAFIYIYEQALNVAMELWVANRLAEGVLPGASSDMSGGSSPSFYLTPGGSAGGGNVQQQGLNQ